MVRLLFPGFSGIARNQTIPWGLIGPTSASAVLAWTYDPVFTALCDHCYGDDTAVARFCTTHSTNFASFGLTIQLPPELAADVRQLMQNVAAARIPTEKLYYIAVRSLASWMQNIIAPPPNVSHG